MIEVGDRAGFGQVGFGIFESIHQFAMWHLDGHRAAQLVVLGQIHQAEPALAQYAFDPVATDAFRKPCERPSRRQRAHRQWATHPRPHRSPPSLQADRRRPCSVVVLTLHYFIAGTQS